MPSKVIKTNNQYVNLVVDYSTEIVGDYPNCLMRWHYSAYLSFSAYGGIDYNGATFTFHTKVHTFNIHYYTGSSGNSPVFASGTLDLPYGKGQSVYHAPGVALNCGNIYYASGSIGASISMPKPSIYHCENPRDIKAKSATFDYKLSNEHNFWRAYLWDSISDNTWNIDPDNTDGTVTLTDLTPETHYKITLKVIDRNGALALTGGKYVEFTTAVDQLRIGIKIGGQIRRARVYLKKDGKCIKVKKGFYKKDGKVKRIKNLGGA